MTRIAIGTLEISYQCLCCVMHIAGCQVQPLGAGRRHDVGRITAQQQTAVAHWLEHI
jgi:hypothetical protein